MGDEGDLQSCMGRVTILAIYFASPPLAFAKTCIAADQVQGPLYFVRARRPPTSGLTTPAPTGPKNRPLVLAILCLYRYTLAALTALTRLSLLRGTTDSPSPDSSTPRPTAVQR